MSIIKDFNAYAKHSGSKIKTPIKVMFWCCVFFRISHFLYKLKLVPFARVFWFINRVFFSIDIDPRATFNGGIVILHGAGVVIGKSVISLGDFKIYQGATLGGNNGKKKEINNKVHSQPIIGKDVVIGINAAVLGPVLLGESCAIGANAVITKDVPSGAVAVSNNKIIE